MSGSLLLWMGLALAVFWGVGLYNRLMRMRARGLDALGSVEKYLRRYADLVSVHLSVPGASPTQAHPVSTEHLPPEWAHLLTILQTLERALKDARGMPLAVEPVARLTQALTALHEAWERLCDAPADLAGPPVPDTMRLQWDAVTLKVEAARGGFNRILTKYNEAIDQFPARLVAGAMGFKPAGLL